MNTLSLPAELWLLPLLFILVYLPQGAAFYLFFRRFLTPKTSAKTLMAGLLFYYLLKASRGDQSTLLYNVAIQLAVYTAITYIFFYGGRVQKLFFSLFYTTVTLAIEMLALYFIQSFTGGFPAGDAEKRWIGFLMVVVVGILGIVALFRLFKVDSPLSLPSGEWAVLTLVPAGSLLILIINMPSGQGAGVLAASGMSAEFAAACGAVLTMNAAVMLLYQRLMARLHLEQHNGMLELQIREYARKLEEEQKDARLRHDLNHIAIGLEALLGGNGRTVELAATKVHLKGLIGRYRLREDGGKTFVSTRVAAIDGIVNAKLAEAEQRGISIGTRLAIPRDLPLSGKEVELAVILGNALDNAVEGFMRLDPQEREGEQHPVVLEMAYGDGLLVLSVHNASPLVHIDGKGTILSAKRPGAKPGIGLQSIRHGVSRFGGSVTFRYENRRFIATAVLPIATECAASDSRISPQRRV